MESYIPWIIPDVSSVVNVLNDVPKLEERYINARYLKTEKTNERQIPHKIKRQKADPSRQIGLTNTGGG
jgi:hypothetical protein